jgi:microcystin-dependent protein
VPAGKKQKQTTNYNHPKNQTKREKHPLSIESFFLKLFKNHIQTMEGYLGEIRMFAGNYAPVNWMFCQGQSLSVVQNVSLFQVIGTIYGGDGRINFKLPDLRSRVPVGTGDGPGLSPTQLGNIGGVQEANITSSTTVALTAANLPAHTHEIEGEVNVSISDQIGAVSVSPNNVLAKQAVDKHVTPNTNIEMYTSAMTATYHEKNYLGGVWHNLKANSTGTGAPISIPIRGTIPVLQPYFGINFIICVHGLLPSKPA